MFQKFIQPEIIYDVSYVILKHQSKISRYLSWVYGILLNKIYCNFVFTLKLFKPPTFLYRRFYDPYLFINSFYDMFFM